MEKIDGLIVIREYLKDVIDEFGNISQIKVVVCRENTYTEKKKESNKRYIDSHREKVTNYVSNYIKNKCQTDPEFHEKVKEQKREYYYRAKEKRRLKNEEDANKNKDE